MSDDRYRQASDLDTETEGDAVVVRMTADEWGVFEGTALDLWRLLTAPRSVGEIAETLSSTYRADAATIARDTAATLAEWERRGLVTRVPSSA
jgi:hypothetical protein